MARETVDSRPGCRRPRGGPPRVLVLAPAPERRLGLRHLLEQADMTVFTVDGSAPAELVEAVRRAVATGAGGAGRTGGT
jgi:hypothetical protein